MKTQSITLIIAILGVLHGPLVAMLVDKVKGRRKPTVVSAEPTIVSAEDHPPIRFRISTPSGIILETDTDELYARSALYRRNWDGWFDLIAGGDAGTTEFSTVPLKIEVKPVRLTEVS